MLRSSLHSFRHGPAMYLAKTLERRARKTLTQNSTLDGLLDKYREKSSSTGVSYSDYLVLYNWVRQHRPREILECGTGISTVVMAQALRENEHEYGIKGRITSMEESYEYHKTATELFPKALDSYAEILLSPAIEDHYHFFRGVRYSDVPSRAYDFVFVDGPSLHTSPQDPHMAINIDLIRILQNARNAVSAIIDTRTTTCYAYSLLLPNTFCYDYIRKIGIVAPSMPRDLRHPKEIVASVMRAHGFRRAPFISTLLGSY